jgi:putative transposase
LTGSFILARSVTHQPDANAMPRAPRFILADQPHHIIQRGNNRQPIFFDDRDRRLFLTMLGEVLEAEGVALHAYVLMTNHIHLLATPRHPAAIGRLMQSLGRRYVGHVNRAQGRTGTLWEGRFKSTIVDSETYVMACYRYIEANPVRAGMVARATDYRWSSHAANAHGATDPRVTPHDCYLGLGEAPGERQAAYRAHFDAGLTPELLDTLRDSAQRGWVPGSETFRQAIAAALGRPVDPPIRGRPRKGG